jgi:hypothetical protein
MNVTPDPWDSLDTMTPDDLTTLLRRHFAMPQGVVGNRERQIARATVRARWGYRCLT